MFTYNIFLYQFGPEPLMFKGFPAHLIHLSVENGIFLLFVFAFETTKYCTQTETVCQVYFHGTFSLPDLDSERELHRPEYLPGIVMSVHLPHHRQ